jgi:uncharacterized membrane protein
MKRIFRYFLQGLIYVAPMGLTLYIIYLIFTFIDGFIREAIQDFFGINIPGIGILAMFIIITFLGFIGNSIILKPIKRLVDLFMEKTPLMNLIYTSIRDLLSAFVGKEKKFNQPVLVKVNTISELEKVGFITQNDLTDIGIKDKVSVYFPHSYNFSGEMFIVPSAHIKPLSMSPADAMKFVVSGGVARS